MTNDLTVGKPGSVLLRFTLPLFISAIFQQMYNIADSIIAGKFAGEDALAAVGASYPITMIFMAIAFGSNIGCSVVISRLFGATRLEEMKTAISTTLIASLVLSAVLTLLGLFFTGGLMRLLNTPANIFADGALYLKVYIAGFVFLFLYNICTGIFTSLGDSKTPLYFLIGSSVGNIFLDILFVAGFHMGVAGVAWATFLAQGVACLFSAALLLVRLRRIKTGAYVRFSFPELGRIGLIAVPSILQQSCISVGNLLIQGLINSYGSAVIAGTAVAFKLNMFAITSFSTLANGMSAFSSQNIGALRFDRVKKGFRSGLLMAVGLAVAFGATYFFFSPQLVGLFLKDAAGSAALQTGTIFLRIVAPAYFFVAIKIFVDGVLRGGGAMSQFIIATIADLALRVILSFALSPVYGTIGIWCAFPLGWALACTVSLIFYATGNWKKHTI